MSSCWAYGESSSTDLTFTSEIDLPAYEAAGEMNDPMLPKETKESEDRLAQYNFVRTIGKGSFSEVKLAVHRATKQAVALKVITKKRFVTSEMERRVNREAEYLQLLRHPHIIKLFTVVETPQQIVMVQEYASGELFEYIASHKKMAENEARRLFQQIICAIEYCHRQRIAHRDLKPENILLDDDNNIKIADFGLSNMITDGTRMKTCCGSPNYAAPEVIGGKPYSGPEIDIWSCGVILYVMLCKKLPFDNQHRMSLYATILNATYPVPDWLKGPPLDLIQKMLTVDPARRISIAGVREDPWFSVDLPAHLQLSSEKSPTTEFELEKPIPTSDIERGADLDVQERLHDEIMNGVTRTMDCTKSDVTEALEADEPSPIKDTYLIMRETMSISASPEPERDNPPFATPPAAAQPAANMASLSLDGILSNSTEVLPTPEESDIDDSSESGSATASWSIPSL